MQTLRLALAQAGYEVIEHVASTIALHRRVSEIKPDVIIIDTDSPDRDTLENLCVISRDQPRPVVLRQALCTPFDTAALFVHCNSAP